MPHPLCKTARGCFSRVPVHCLNPLAGLPCVAFAGFHPPEIYYLKDGKNGFLIKDNSLKKLEEKIDLLLENKELYTQFSNNAKKIILEEANIDKMFQGFLDSIIYVAGP